VKTGGPFVKQLNNSSSLVQCSFNFSIRCYKDLKDLKAIQTELGFYSFFCSS